MIRVVSKDLWREIRALVVKGSTKAAAIAYVSTNEMSFRAGDILVTDASDDQIASGQTVASVLDEALERGAAVYSLPNLHAKVIVIDRVAVIGSGNMSESSADGHRIEAAVITNIPSVVSSARGFIEGLTKLRTATRVDDPFIRRISRIEVKRRPRRGGRGRKPPQVKPRDSRTWLVTVHLVDEDWYEDECELIEQGRAEAKTRKKNRNSTVTWIRMTANSRFRKDAEVGDSVIQILTDEKGKRVVKVYPHSTILVRQKEPRCTRFYIEESRSISQQTMKWANFKKLLRSAGLSWEPTKGCTREVPQKYDVAIHAMWGKSR